MTDRDLWSDVADDLAQVGPVTYGDPSRDATIGAMADRAIAEAPDRFVLVGFSMGGYVARAIARRVPDRVRALVLIATSSRADTPAQVQRKAAAIAHVRRHGFAGLSRGAIQRSVHPARADDAALIARIRAMGDRLGGGVFLRQAEQARESDRDDLGRITCPTLVIAAAQDALRGRDEAHELRAGIPNATLTVIEGSGHMLPMEAPAALSGVIVPWLLAQASGASTIGS